MKLRNKFQSYRKSQLQITPVEAVRDSIIQSGLEAAYAAGNSTEKVAKVASTAENLINGGTTLVGGSEASSSLNRIIFKAGRDIARGDTTCTGLCCM